MARVRESPTVYLDTHIVAWLHAGLVDRLSPAAMNALESAGMLLISPIVELELTYLKEIGRFRSAAMKALDVLADEIGLQRSEIPLRDSIREAVKQSWTRDPFDRLIVGEALASGASLVTRDRNILNNCAAAIW
jgi:PIN domain nuclease of toxin-antitoxin system